MYQTWRLLGFATVGALLLSSCAHQTKTSSLRLSAASQDLVAEAKRWTAVDFEEDYQDARLVYHALPDGIAEKARLREVLLSYLLRNQVKILPRQVRQDPGYIGPEGSIQQLDESFRDALDLLPARLKYAADYRGLSPAEHRLLLTAAKLNVAVFSPRGNELPVLTALMVLRALEPENQEWTSRLEEVLKWLDSGAQISAFAPMGMRGPNLTDTFMELAASWPNPRIFARLEELAMARQDQVAGLFRRPLGTGGSTRSLLSEILFDTEALSSAAMTVVAMYLRYGAIEEARDLARRFADKPSDDPETRKLLEQATQPSRTLADYLALARRFLPPLPPLGGTATDRIDPRAALGILSKSLDAFPEEPELLVLSGRVARLLSHPLLARRLLEEAGTLLFKRNQLPDLQTEVATERMELAFVRLKMQMDPDHLLQAEHAAHSMRNEFFELRKRYANTSFRYEEGDIDYLLATVLVDAGQGDKADPLLAKARKTAEVEATRQLASLAIKRGEPQKAIALLSDTLATRGANAMARDTIGFVEGQARLLFILGTAHEVNADLPAAKKTWGQSLHHWERLQLEYHRRKDSTAGAETTFEIGKLYYLLDRREEGLRKLTESIEQDSERDQGYLEGIAFLVQRGETDAALDIFRRAMARPGRELSEYMKVYTSLWIVDLTRRSLGTSDPTATTYLKSIANRTVNLRPLRTSDWYTRLARYATHQIGYPALLASADTVGKQAEAHFYEALRQLGIGQNTSAHALWTKVIESKMVSFFEYEMAARYLRCGAPASPTKSAEDMQTI